MIVTNSLIFDVLHQNTIYLDLQNNKKSTLQSSKIKTLTNTQNPTPFSLAFSSFQCGGRCLHTTAMNCSPSLCAHAIFGECNLCLLMHSSVSWQPVVVVSPGQKLNDYEPLVNLLPRVSGKILQLTMFTPNWVCTTIMEKKKLM